MDNNYKLTVNGELEFDLTEEDISQLDTLETSQNTYHILVKGKSFKAKIAEAHLDQKRYVVQVKSNTYEVEISDSLDQLIEEMGFSLASAVNVSEIEAPMPGLILDINVRVGQAVNEDDPLLILEAMKMENIITSPRDGIIKAVQVKKGQAVDKDDLLIEFE